MIKSLIVGALLVAPTLASAAPVSAPAVDSSVFANDSSSSDAMDFSRGGRGGGGGGGRGRGGGGWGRGGGGGDHRGGGDHNRDGGYGHHRRHGGGWQWCSPWEWLHGDCY